MTPEDYIRQAEAIAKSQAAGRLRAEHRRQRHGHTFDRDRRCRCGLTELSYALESTTFPEDDDRAICPTIT